MTPKELTAIYSPIVSKVVAKMFGEDDREDASQAIWLVLLSKDVAGIHDNDKGPLEHFTYMVAKNAALDIKRAMERHARMDREVEEELAVLDPTEVTPTETGIVFPEFEGTEAHKAQQAATLTLLLEGYNQKEIAEKMEVTTTWSNKLTNAIREAALGVPRNRKDYRPMV
jgi:DNA-directed RNA polymerase specialized sigma24 family protein